jgi:hypothetical protein
MTKKKEIAPIKRDPNKILFREAIPCKDMDEAQSRAALSPNVSGAMSIRDYFGGGDLTGLFYALDHEIKKANSGDLSRVEGTLITQAHTLDAIFNSLAQRANRNIKAGHLDASEKYLRLALKAQSQCRTTLETLATIKNPPQVAFVKQANIATGPQQVNNGAEASRAREIENQQSKLLATSKCKAPVGF